MSIPLRQTAAEYEAAWARSLANDQQRHLFAAEMMQVRKDQRTGALLAFFLGGLGIHRFYLNDLWGIAYLVFCWTFIPAIIALVETFMMFDRVEAYNKKQAYLIASRIRAYSPAASTGVPQPL
jgi:TM2 domain-containing membrane protein YozV